MPPEASKPKTKTKPKPAAPRGGAAAIGGKVIDPLRIARQNVVPLVVAGVAGLVVGVIFYVVALLFFPKWGGQVVFEISPELSTADDILSNDRRTADMVTRLARTEMSRLMSPDVLRNALQKRDIRSTKWSEQFVEKGTFNANEALVVLEDELGTSHPRDTNTFKASWSGTSRNDVPVILTAVQQPYLDALTGLSDSKYNSNLKTFSDQLRELEDQILYLETDKQNFVRENNITSLNEAVNERNDKIESLNRQLAETRQNAQLLASRVSQLRSKIDGQLDPTEEEVRTAEQEPVLRNLKTLIHDYRVQLGSERARFSDDHPTVRRLQRQLTSVEGEYDTALNEVIQRNLTASYKESTDSLSSQESLLEQLEADHAETTTSLRDYASALGSLQSLDRRLDTAMEDRDELSRLIANLNQVRVRADAAKVTVMQTATLPKERSFPKIQVVVPACMFVCVGLVAGIIFVREFLDNRLKYPSDFAALPGARLLGVIPDISDDPTGVQETEMVVRDEPDSVIAETYRQAASRVVKDLEASGSKSLLLMSGMPEAGTTTIAANLAASIAATGRKVIVVDANFRRPRLESAALVSPARQGLGDVLSGEAPVESVIVSTPDSLDIIGAGSEQNRVFEKLNTPTFDETRGRQKQDYDMVLIDGPPGVVSGDALMLASKCDSALLVVRSGSEERGLVGRLINQLGQMEASFIGVIFNRPRNTAGGYFKKNFLTMANYTPKD
ncbi:MAG: AAA family ATPase [Planctomycetota bacterium]|nr:AAA family ATPase [Planctomycetota bacterium]